MLQRPPYLPEDANLAWTAYLGAKSPRFDNPRAKTEAMKAFFYAFEAGKRAKESE